MKIQRISIDHEDILSMKIGSLLYIFADCYIESVECSTENESRLSSHFLLNIEPRQLSL